MQTEYPMKRTFRAQLAAETVEICQRGWYQPNGNMRVDISSQLATCLQGTKLYSPIEIDHLVDQILQSSEASRTVFDVINETTLSAARRLVNTDSGASTLCLNFASAKNPGGGFLGGS